MPEQQLLRDPSLAPAAEIIAAGLGAADSAYVKFIAGLKAHNIQVDWRYYQDGQAWLGKALYQWTTTRGTAKEMTACWLSIWQGFFKVSVFIPQKARDAALELPLGPEIKQMIESSRQMEKLKFFPVIFDVRSDHLLDDIYTLIDFKVSLK